MSRWSIGRMFMTVGVALVVWGALAGACLLVGSTGRIGFPTATQLGYRLGPVLQASLVGAALAGAGVVYQAILRNPLADPYLLGVSSGASLFAYLWELGAAVTLAGPVYALSEQAFTFIGAILSVGVVFSLASSRGRLEPITLLLVGVIVNAVNGSLFLLINAITRDRPGVGSPLTFLVGGIQSNLTAGQVGSAATVVGIGWVALMYFAGQLNVAALSEEEAESLGVRISRLRWISLIVASLVTAAAVAISGPIGFVGLVCPHLTRLFVGGDVRKVLPIATALGAGLLAVADAACRCLAREGMAATLLPVGVLTGLLGGPFFLLLLWQNRPRSVAEVRP